MKNLGEYLSPEYSWWMLADYNMIALNPEINPTAENIRIIFYCKSCNEYHVVELCDVKLHHDGDYDFCCLESTALGDYEDYISPGDVPMRLVKIFKEASASFEKNYYENDAD